jgi:hypothetical protein
MAFLHQRLEHEGRHQAVHGAVVGLHAQAQPVAEAQGLEVQVTAREVPLLAQRDLVDGLAVEAQTVPQQVTDALDGLLGQRGVPPHQAQERVQRVQDEVRVELAAQRRQLRAGAQQLGARGAGGLFAHAGRVLPGVRGSHEGGIHQAAVQDLVGHRPPRELHVRPHHQAHVGQDQEVPAGDGEGNEGQGQRHVHEDHAGAAVLGGPRYRPRGPQHDETHHRPRDDDGHRGPDGLRRRGAERGEPRGVQAGAEQPRRGVEGRAAGPARAPGRRRRRHGRLRRQG